MSVTVKIGGSIAGLKAALTKGKQEVNNFAKVLKTAVAGASVAMAGRWISSQISAVVDRLDELGKKARGLGLTAEEMQKIEYAAKSANVPVDKVSASITKMLDTVAGAASGNKSASDALARIGLTAKELQGMGVYDQFTTLVEAIKSIPDPAERAAAAMDIFGKGLAQNAAFFADFSQNVEAFKKSGRMISDEDVRAAEEIKKAMLEIEQSWQRILVNTGYIRAKADIMSQLAEMASGNGDAWINYGDEFIKRAVRVLFPWTNFTGTADAVDKYFDETNYGAIPFRRSKTAKTPQQIAEEEANAAVDAALVDFFGDLASAVDNIADKVDATKQPRSAMRGGGDPTFTDALRRVGGDLGYNYRGNQQQFVKAAADASERAAEALEAIHQQGVTLRG